MAETDGEGAKTFRSLAEQHFQSASLGLISAGLIWLVVTTYETPELLARLEEKQIAISAQVSRMEGMAATSYSNDEAAKDWARQAHIDQVQNALIDELRQRLREIETER